MEMHVDLLTVKVSECVSGISTSIAIANIFVHPVITTWHTICQIKLFVSFIDIHLYISITHGDNQIAISC